jgi:hypothetical protein
MVRDRLHDVEGLQTTVRKIDPAVATPASYLVDISFPGDLGVLCEVADSLHDVRVMDPDGMDVTVEEALAYVHNRADGMSPTEAWRGV